MAYESGKLDKRVSILNRGASVDGAFGRVAGEYVEGATIWASVDWSRGVKSLREGAYDAYDVVMVRCRWRCDLTRESRLLYDGRTWQIDSFHADERANTIQITATELTE